MSWRMYMKTKLPILIIIGLFVAVAFIIPVVSAKSPFQVHGSHYNLNIIGVKTSDQIKEVGDSMGHTMFVKLSGRTKIIMTQDAGGVFQVVDRNGLDNDGAEFNIAPGYYNVYARALGKPNNNYVDITARGEFDDAQEGETLIWLGAVNLARESKKPQSVNINRLFYVDVTLCTEYDEINEVCTETTSYDDYWVFGIDELMEYWWDYDNYNLKLLQVRFYECTLDATGVAKDFCRWGNGDPIDSIKSIV